jgi:Mg2+/Co2+ transporter CorB
MSAILAVYLTALSAFFSGPETQAALIRLIAERLRDAYYEGWKESS